MTQEGILYDKSGETILSIPPSVSQDVVIREGCVHINKDMLNSWQYPKDTVSQHTHIDAFFPHFRTLSIPSTLVDITLDYAFHCMTELESISVHPDNPNFTSRDGLLYTKSMDTLVGYPTGKRRYNPGIEVIPEGVKTIAPTVFADTYWLESISFPSTLESIGKWAFEFYGFVEGTDYIPRLNTIYSYAMTAPTLGEEAFVSIPANGTLHIKAGATGYNAWLNAGLTGWTIVEDL